MARSSTGRCRLRSRSAREGPAREGQYVCPARGAMPLIRTERLRLRPLALSDARPLARLLRGDAEAVRMTERLPEPCTEPAARDWIRYHHGPGEHAFAIETLGEGEFVGCISFSRAGEEVGLG